MSRALASVVVVAAGRVGANENDGAGDGDGNGEAGFGANENPLAGFGVVVVEPKPPPGDDEANAPNPPVDAGFGNAVEAVPPNPNADGVGFDSVVVVVGVVVAADENGDVLSTVPKLEKADFGFSPSSVFVANAPNPPDVVEPNAGFGLASGVSFADSDAGCCCR